MVDIQLNNDIRTIGGIHMTNPHPWLSVRCFIVLLKINAKKELLDPLGAAGNMEAVKYVSSLLDYEILERHGNND